MGTKKSTRAARRNPSRRKCKPSLISHQPGKGLVVSTKAGWPDGLIPKITEARCIIQAVVASKDSLDGEDYDISWPLDVVVRLLGEARELANEMPAASP